MDTTHKVRIKKDYAVAPREDRKKVDAIELAINGGNIEVPQSQIDKIKKRVDYYDKNPHELISWNEVRKRLKLG